MEYVQPSKLARYGTLVTCGVLLLIGMGTWFIQYPEVISTEAKLTGTAPPKPLVSKINARIIQLSFKNGDRVYKGDNIAVLESTADLNQIMALSKIVDSLSDCLDRMDISSIHKLMNNKLHNLGELQPAYQFLIQVYIPYKDYVSGNYIQRKKIFLNDDLRIYKELLLVGNQAFTQQALFQQAVYNLKSKLEEWKRNYLITATEDGILNFAGFYKESQYIEAGKPIAYIIPSHNTIYAEMIIPQSNFGKVQQGQKVILKFNAYPWQEFGTVMGKVEYISLIPVDNGNYLAKVNLPNQLMSNYKKKLSFREGLLADAEIITRDVKLTERLYYDIEQQLRK